MAKGRVKMVCADCGAEYWAEKTCYNRREADSWEQWMQGQQGCCPVCYAKRKAAERDAQREKENADALNSSNELGLPALEGSDKQVAWATTIRYNTLMYVFGRDPASIKAEYRQMIADVLAERTDARWWIDNRGATAERETRAAIESALAARK